ncbi:MAG: hypothetical protein AB1297_09365 [bacterium]
MVKYNFKGVKFKWSLRLGKSDKVSGGIGFVLNNIQLDYAYIP